jgi:signal transduction histidine kinase
VRFICSPIGDGAAYVQIGDPVGDVQATLHAIAEVALPLLPVLLLLSSAGGWLMANRALRPMQTITRTLAEIQAADLSRRVTVASPDREVADLVATLNRLLDRLQRTFDALRQFAGDVSHQIKTPLTVMQGSLEGAKRRGVNVQDDVLFQQLSDEISTISATVADLQTFALADAPVDPAGVVDISAVAADTLDIVSALAELKGVEVQSAIEGGALVAGDALRIKQVMLNLGDNAVKYTLAGGSVSLEVRSEDGAVILNVADTGIGIHERDLPRVFDRLFRADAADRSGGGAGLGLAIAKRIVEAHRGTIAVTSKPGTGTTFTVTLPRIRRPVAGKINQTGRLP